MRKIVVVSSSRADYGILKWIMKEIEKYFKLEIIIIGNNPLIEQDEFKVIREIPLLKLDGKSDNYLIASDMGRITNLIAKELYLANPDLLLILGDRYETLAIATAALLLKIPIAHLCGGDITEGAFDDSIRHAITKMSHLHFVSNFRAKQIVEQMGENPSYVFNVGNPGLDILSNFNPTNKEQLEQQFKFQFREKNLLITFHPETLSNEPSKKQFKKILDAIDKIKSIYDIGVIFTYPNADPDNQSIINMINEFTHKYHWASAANYLGQQNYLSFIYYCDIVIGNSSSGLYEVPSLKKPTINIGDRQKGRLKADSVIDCRCEVQDIINAIKKAFGLDCSNVINPYWQGDSSKKIVEILKEIPDYKILLNKSFNIIQK